MYILPAIDLYNGKAVRLLRGDYDKMTVYSENPVSVADAFIAAGAGRIHVVDLEGARSGGTPNFDTVAAIASRGVFTQTGGGVRSMAVIERYMRAGISRVILGTAAAEDRTFLEEALRRYGSRIAVGVDIRDGYVAVKGWTEKSGMKALDFMDELQAMETAAVIVTDISRDGAMAGANRELYGRLVSRYSMEIIASGGVSTMEDVTALRDTGVAGVIIGRAWYTGAIDLKEAIGAVK